MLGQNVGVMWWERRGPGVETEEGGESERDREKAGLCQEAGSVALTCIVTGDQRAPHGKEERKQQIRQQRDAHDSFKPCKVMVLMEKPTHSESQDWDHTLKMPSHYQHLTKRYQHERILYILQHWSVGVAKSIRIPMV